MPQIIIEYNQDFGFRLLEELRTSLAKLATTLFRSDDSLNEHSFSFKFDRVLPPSTSTHSIIIRIHLHNYEKRINAADHDARVIRDLVISLLDSSGHYLGDIGPTVGVSLSYGQVAWSDGSYDDVDDRGRREVFALLDGKRLRPIPPGISEIGTKGGKVPSSSGDGQANS